MPTPARTFSRLSHIHRQCIFGNVVDSKIELNEYGHILAEEWERSKDIRQEVALDAFVVMPNHIHGVVIMTNHDVGATGRSPSPSGPYKRNAPWGPSSRDLNRL